MRQMIWAGLLPALLVFSCSSTDSAIFASLETADQLATMARLAMQDEDYSQADSLYLLAIETLETTYQQDTTNAPVCARLGAIYYELDAFRPSVEWYVRAVMRDSSRSQHYYQLGMGLVRIGDVRTGQLSLEKAVNLDNSDTLAAHIVGELHSMGQRLYRYGHTLHEAGDTTQGSGYQIYGIGLLMTAFDLDSSRHDLARSIVDYCYAIGDDQSATTYARLLD